MLMERKDILIPSNKKSNETSWQRPSKNELYSMAHESIHNIYKKFQITEDYHKPESPYILNEKLLKLIFSLKEDFNTTLEKNVLSLMNKIDTYPNMSPYQFSLSQKELADCYLEHGITGNALELYKLGLKKNKNLPVKRIISKLEKIQTQDLVYSLDINLFYNDEPLSKAQSKDEYDPEFESFIQEQLDELGPEYRKSFYQFVQEHEFGGGFNTYLNGEAIWTYKDWALKTLESFKKSKEFSESKESKT